MKKQTIAALLVFCMLFAACGATQHKTVPAQLIGVWTTSNPKYADRYFELKRDTLVLGTGEEEASVHTVTLVEEDQSGEGKFTFTVHYRGADGEDTLVFDYDSRTQHVRLKNQKDIEWVRMQSTSL